MSAVASAPPLPPRCARAFRVERALASGGFGAVYVARQLELDRPVALKLLDPEACRDEDQLARFHDEARAAAGVQHPYIVRVLSHDVEDGVAWIAYELVDGEALDRVIARGPLPPAEALAMGGEVASALAAIHELGIVHRDVKPANVIRARSGAHKLTDFGIARFAQQSHRTATGILVGTPVYMAPEVIRGETPAGAADVYALGVMLHEAISGTPPFLNENVHLVLAMHTDRPAPALQAHGLSPHHARLVARMLAKDPAERPSAAEVERALGRTAPEIRPRRAPSRVRPARPSSTARFAGFALVAGVVFAGLVAVALRAPAVRTVPVTPSPTVAAVASPSMAAVATDPDALQAGLDADSREVDVDRAVRRLSAYGGPPRTFRVNDVLAGRIVARLARHSDKLLKDEQTALAGFEPWYERQRHEFNFMGLSRRALAIKYLQELRKSGPVAHLDEAAATVLRDLDSIGPTIRAAFALDLPAGDGFNAANMVAIMRETALLLRSHRRNDDVERFPRDQVKNLPETWTLVLLDAFCARAGGRRYFDPLERAVTLYESRFRAAPTAKQRFVAGKLLLELLHAQPKPFFDDQVAKKVLDRWPYWLNAGPVDPHIRGVDEKLSKRSGGP